MLEFNIYKQKKKTVSYSATIIGLEFIEFDC